MAKRKAPKGEGGATEDGDAEAARERQLREMIERVEDEKSGTVPPTSESPHDFVERKRREGPEK